MQKYFFFIFFLFFFNSTFAEEKIVYLDVNILLHDLLIIMDDDDLACPKSNGSWEGLKNVLNADGLTLLD